jgi:hypothetical protein
MVITVAKRPDVRRRALAVLLYNLQCQKSMLFYSQSKETPLSLCISASAVRKQTKAACRTLTVQQRYHMSESMPCCMSCNSGSGVSFHLNLNND